MPISIITWRMRGSSNWASYCWTARSRPQNQQWFNKPPAQSSPTPAHQDGFYFCLVPNEAVNMWLALDEINQDNGCIRYVAGSHHRGLRPHGQSGVLGLLFNTCQARPESPGCISPQPGGTDAGEGVLSGDAVRRKRLYGQPRQLRNRLFAGVVVPILHQSHAGDGQRTRRQADDAGVGLDAGTETDLVGDSQLTPVQVEGIILRSVQLTRSSIMASHALRDTTWRS